MDDGSVAMAAEVEVAWHSVYLEEPFHSTTLLAVDILDDPLKLLIVIHVLIVVDLVVGQWNLLQIVLHVDQMHLEDVLDIQGQERARVAWELDIEVDFEFFCEVLLIDYQIWVHFWRREVDYRHNCQEGQHCDWNYWDTGSGDGSFAVLAGDSLVKVYRAESLLETRKHRSIIYNQHTIHSIMASVDSQPTISKYTTHHYNNYSIFVMNR